MWDGDFTPRSSWRAKPISKKELAKLRKNYERADEIVRLAKEKEEEEKKRANQEVEDMLNEIV
jgi:hypothetical protein